MGVEGSHVAAGHRIILWRRQGVRHQSECRPCSRFVNTYLGHGANLAKRFRSKLRVNTLNAQSGILKHARSSGGECRLNCADKPHTGDAMRTADHPKPGHL